MSDPKFKPLLAAPVEFDKLDYTNLCGSPKLDGIRCIIRDGVAVSRSLKPIPNAHVQALFGRTEFEGLDGELIVGDVCAKDVYRVTDSAVMSKKGEPGVKLWVFDHVERPNDDYWQRHQHASTIVFADHRAGPGSSLKLVDRWPIESHQALLDLEEQFLKQGFEGLMLRASQGPASWYKYGRSTAKQGTLLKVKRFTDAEAYVTGFEELMKNGNEATTNELGRTERSSHAENLIPMNTLGALQCKTIDGIDFKIGTGFDQATRQKIWDNKDAWLGSIVKFKSFEIGVKTAPRFPVFLGQRADIDL